MSEKAAVASRAEEMRRNRIVHGWAFRDHTEEEVAGVLLFLETGDASRMPEQYRPLLELEGERPPKKRRSRPSAEGLAALYPLAHNRGYEALTGKHHAITIERRPDYCDRGHWIAKVFPVAGGKVGDFTIDNADGWPRYYMKHDRAVEELREWLAWREDQVWTE